MVAATCSLTASGPGPTKGMDNIPEFLKVPSAVAGFRARLAVQRPHQVLNFDSIEPARKKYQAASSIVASWFPDKMYDLPRNEEMKQTIWEMGAAQALFEDLASIIILLAGSTLERFRREVKVDLYERGVDCYIPGIKFVRAVAALANQYKHLGQWRHEPRPKEPDRDIIEVLVGNPLRSDAAAEFLKRCAFSSYDSFESALLTCSDGIADPSFMADGRRGMRTITIRSRVMEDSHRDSGSDIK